MFVIFAALTDVTEFAGGTERYCSALVQNSKFIQIFVTRKKVYKGKLLPNSKEEISDQDADHE